MNNKNRSNSCAWEAGNMLTHFLSPNNKNLKKNYPFQKLHKTKKIKCPLKNHLWCFPAQKSFSPITSRDFYLVNINLFANSTRHVIEYAAKRGYSALLLRLNGLLTWIIWLGRKSKIRLCVIFNDVHCLAKWCVWEKVFIERNENEG